MSRERVAVDFERWVHACLAAHGDMAEMGRWQDAILEVQSRKVVLSHEASVHGVPAVRHSVAVRIASKMHRLRGMQCDSSAHVIAEWQAEFEREITLCCKS